MRDAADVLGSMNGSCWMCKCDAVQVAFKPAFSSKPLGTAAFSKIEYKDTGSLGGMGLMTFIIPETVTTKGATIAVCRSAHQVSTDIWVLNVAYSFSGLA